MDEETKKILEDYERRIKELESYLPKQQTEKIIKKISLQEFLLEKNPLNDVQRTLLFGYYLEKFGGKEYFSVREIIECFKKAKEPTPINPSDKIQKCISNGWVMQGKEQKTYALTNSGIKVIEGVIWKKGKRV